MTRRNAFVVVVAALAMTGLLAQSAQAASFHKPKESVTITMRPDGTGKTAHQVFDFASASLTCAGAVGEATVEGVGETFSAIETSLLVETATCSYLGQKANVSLSPNCSYVYNANGTADIKCGGGEGLTFSVPSPACHVFVPAQTGNLAVNYQNVGAPSEITVQPNVTGTNYTSTGAGCVVAGTFNNGTYTTGNVILTGERKGTLEQVAISWE